MIRTVPEVIHDKMSLLRLWHHECMRVLSDRFVSEEDHATLRSAVHSILEHSEVVASVDEVRPVQVPATRC